MNEALLYIILWIASLNAICIALIILGCIKTIETKRFEAFKALAGGFIIAPSCLALIVWIFITQGG